MKVLTQTDLHLYFQSLKMMYDYRLNLAVRTPHGLPWGVVSSMIKNPSHNTKQEAVKRNFFTYEKIVNPTKADQLAVVRQNPGAIRLIKNPHKETIRYVYDKDPDIKKHLISFFGKELIEKFLKETEKPKEPEPLRKHNGVMAVPDWIR